MRNGKVYILFCVYIKKSKCRACVTTVIRGKKVREFSNNIFTWRQQISCWELPKPQWSHSRIVIMGPKQIFVSEAVWFEGIFWVCELHRGFWVPLSEVALSISNFDTTSISSESLSCSSRDGYEGLCYPLNSGLLQPGMWQERKSDNSCCSCPGFFWHPP